MTTIPIIETMEQEVAEGGSALITFTLKDELKAPVPLVSILDMKLTLYDRATLSAVGGGIINGKNGTNILNVNGGTYHATSGAGTLALGPLDNPIVDPTKRGEWHIAFIVTRYNGGAGVCEKGALIKVVNLDKVP